MKLPFIRTSLVKKMLKFALDEIMAIDETLRLDPNAIHHPFRRREIKERIIKRVYEFYGFK